MKRILLNIQFLGTNYSGWQIQPKNQTVQQTVQDAILNALNESVELFSSSRTDAGVHAYSMPAHFDTSTKIIPTNIYKAINAYLPSDIKVLSSTEVSKDFHARFNVKQKTYEYNFYSSIVPLPLIDATSARIPTPFDFELAKSACPYFLGKKDFKAFCSAGNQTLTTIREIKFIDLIKTEQGYKLIITGDGFLYNMVRIIVGTLIEIGQGKIDPHAIPNILESKDRKNAGKTAEPRGLVLKNVEY